MLNEDGTLAVVVNGEIYNFEALRDELVAKGHSFRSRSDSEVVLHLYEEHGEDCVARLQGMFAFVLYDARSGRLLAARDRSGKKPLYYRMTRHGVAFASEVHALVRAFDEEPPTVDLAGVDEYLTLGYTTAPNTIYKGISRLRAAHYAVFTPGKAHAPVRYWQLARHPPLRGSDNELADELRWLLMQAVKRRLVSDVPLGAFLSGGIDSSTIVALMARLSPRPVKTFSIGFPQETYSEVKYARMVAKQYGTEHHELVVTARMTDVAQEIVRHHGEPFADPSSIATWHLAKLTREHVTVALSGDAGDENFGGYKRYNTTRLGHAYDALPEAMRPTVKRVASAVAGVLWPSSGRFADALDAGEATRYLALMNQLPDDARARLYSASMSANADARAGTRFAQVIDESDGRFAMARVLDVDFHTYLTDDINAKVDIAAMAHALEVRCPFLDTDVIEFAARLPAHMLMRGMRGKFLLRHMARQLLPWQVIHRPKMGFGIPLDHWLRHDLRELLHDTLLDRRARERGLFEPYEVAALVRTLDGHNPQVYRIWTLFILELWFREFIDGANAA
jgi:asparagine synthase (glutamine-hydrolysing)